MPFAYYALHIALCSEILDLNRDRLTYIIASLISWRSILDNAIKLFVVFLSGYETLIKTH